MQWNGMQFNETLLFLFNGRNIQRNRKESVSGNGVQDPQPQQQQPSFLPAWHAALTFDDNERIGTVRVGRNNAIRIDSNEMDR